MVEQPDLAWHIIVSTNISLTFYLEITEELQGGRLVQLGKFVLLFGNRGLGCRLLALFR